jgi:hypothetical protein
MILNNAPTNEAIVSNVGEIGEFRIKSSNRAFQILSSGLYANKVRAIIRELSCNAYDSHVAAGKGTMPFDVHLPSVLAPYFAVRDYGTGLSHEQVTNIYTTYFESTKTGSNDFVGALGLGSKSPFSYTDNFTVTAIRDSRKGIYTAFINEAGVPSIALMFEETTSEPAGVEVRFAVNDRADFAKFAREAQYVYRSFTLLPVVTGNADFNFERPAYIDQNIIPGVHCYQYHKAGSVSVMGNIAYPIEIPQADTSLGDLRNLLGCGLEIHFAIGELDFQASREGLSYIPSTVDAIKRKLTVLVSKLAEEVNAIPELWDRAVYLHKKRDQRLWAAAVAEYIKSNDLPTYDTTYQYGARPRTFAFKVEELAKNWNIQVKGLGQTRRTAVLNNLKADTVYADGHAKDANGRYITWQVWQFQVDEGSVFVVNDLKVGAGERARFHFRGESITHYSRNIWILERADKTKEMNTAAFFAAICEPPHDRRYAASTLNSPKRERVATNVTILKLEARGQRGHSYRRNGDELVWRDAGDTSEYPAVNALTGQPITYYYVPLSGFVMESTKGYSSAKELLDDVSVVPGLFNGELYGVRKKDIEDIKTRPNWKNFEEYISEQLAKRDMNRLLMSMVLTGMDNADILKFNLRDVTQFVENPESPYTKFVKPFIGVDKLVGSRHNIDKLFKRFATSKTPDPSVLQGKYMKELNAVTERYPLLSKLNTYRVPASELAEYINMCDQKKGI